MNKSELIIQGSFLNVFGVGILITGKPGIGKSELALGLIYRSHQFIADDAPLFFYQNKRIYGRSPISPPYISIRGIGLIDTLSHFGLGSSREDSPLDLIIHLEEKHSDPHAHLQGETSTKDVLGCLIPSVTIPIIKPRNLEVLVETIAKSFLLKKHKDTESVNIFNELLLQKMASNRS